MPHKVTIARSHSIADINGPSSDHKVMTRYSYRLKVDCA